MPRLVRLSALVLSLLLGTAAHALDASHPRDGCPHVAATAAATGELRVVFLGGSITAAEGWRTLTTERLRQLFPDAKVVATDAGLPGTGSDLGACRVERDVLRHRPDLVFVEFAVNDASTPPDRVEQTVEGIVRQVKRARPGADLCFLYTISTPGLPDLEAGRFPPAAAAMERVAAHYGIPSLHLGVAVVQAVAAGRMVFKGTPADGERAFSLDGVHPTAAGHRLYFEQIAAFLPALFRGPAPAAAPLPPARQATNWERAGLQEIAPALLRGEWAPVAADDANLRGVTKALLPPTWRTATPGAALEAEFTGTRFGLLGIASPDNGEFIVTIDALPPERATFFDAYASPTFCRVTKWFSARELPPGRHRVRIELGAAPLDKAAIKARAGKTLEPAAAYAPQRLTLSGLLTVDTATP